MSHSQRSSISLSTPFLAPEYTYTPRRKRRTLSGTVLLILTSIALGTAVFTLLKNDHPGFQYLHSRGTQAAIPEPNPHELWATQVSKWVNGRPTDNFQGT